MSQEHLLKVTQELQIPASQVNATIMLLDEGATVPFIARYRKEVTGGLDELQVIAIRDRIEQLREIDKRRETILKSMDEQKVLTPELKKKIMEAQTLSELEDIYLPFKPKRRTRGMVAKEKGLEPLAQMIFEQGNIDPLKEAEAFVDEEKEVKTSDDALAGARDIIAEWINEDADVRAQLRELFEKTAVLHSKVLRGKEEEGVKYQDYYDWEEAAADVPSHRCLAIRRGASEGFLGFRILPDEVAAIEQLEEHVLKAENATTDQMKQAIKDSYKRLLSMSMETEFRLILKQRADEEAIRVFSENVRELLLAAPLGQRAVIGLDPGLRTGCKLVCLDPQGKLLTNQTIYPLAPQKQEAESAALLKHLVQHYQIEAIAIGNGTGGREAQKFCESIDFQTPVTIVMVNESGASIYSASEAAREEFPDYDLTVRGAVSIARRLMDPLAELVKLDPKSIGVGQYQHDVDQKSLKKSLDDVVMSCVNAVGVEINTASKQLISYVSGLSERLAASIVSYRDTHGAYQSRADLMSVTGMGPKAFEQAAGFLRIRNASNALDASAVHPESYSVVSQMAKDLQCEIQEMIGDQKLDERLTLKSYVTDSIGLPTLQDIVEELAKPGRDPREQFEAFSFAEGVNDIVDLKVGMKLPGVITNVTNFGAFVDIGVHQDGLVHISELADKFVQNPHDEVKVQQRVQVTVTEVDVPRRRIALSMRKQPFDDATASQGKPKGGKSKTPVKRSAPKKEASLQDLFASLNSSL